MAWQVASVNQNGGLEPRTLKRKLASSNDSLDYRTSSIGKLPRLDRSYKRKNTKILLPSFTGNEACAFAIILDYSQCKKISTFWRCPVMKLFSIMQSSTAKLSFIWHGTATSVVALFLIWQNKNMYWGKDICSRKKRREEMWGFEIENASSTRKVLILWIDY